MSLNQLLADNTDFELPIENLKLFIPEKDASALDFKVANSE